MPGRILWQLLPFKSGIITYGRARSRPIGNTSQQQVFIFRIDILNVDKFSTWWDNENNTLYGSTHPCLFCPNCSALLSPRRSSIIAQFHVLLCFCILFLCGSALLICEVKPKKKRVHCLYGCAHRLINADQSVLLSYWQASEYHRWNYRCTRFRPKRYSFFHFIRMTLRPREIVMRIELHNLKTLFACARALVCACIFSLIFWFAPLCQLLFLFSCLSFITFIRTNRGVHNMYSKQLRCIQLVVVGLFFHWIEPNRLHGGCSV